MLEFDTYIPDDIADGAPLVVLLHGRGADKDDLAGLRPHLSAESILALPRAPFPGAPWGYGPGWAWYRYLGGSQPEAMSFRESLGAMDAFLDALPSRLPVRTGPIVLGGFSQGGTLSLAYALSRPGRIPFVLNFSGFLADHPDVRVTPESVRRTRFFWGHGTHDPAIPIALAHAGQTVLRDSGADLMAIDYPIGHWIDPVELGDAVDWIRKGIRDLSRGSES